MKRFAFALCATIVSLSAVAQGTLSSSEMTQPGARLTRFEGNNISTAWSITAEIFCLSG